MRNIVPNKKQKLSLAAKYKLYLSKLSVPKDKLSNKNNLMDDLNTTDKTMMKEIRSYAAALSIERAKHPLSPHSL
jgi:hypothetical protein